MSNPQTIFFLGATGYIASQFLVSVKRDAVLDAKLREYTLVALVRNPDDQKAKKLVELWPGVILVKGTLDDRSIIEENAQNSVITFNAADSLHDPSVKAIISGLQKRSAANPEDKQPLYIHVSGLSILSDNSRGEPVPTEKAPRFSDSTFSLDDVPESNVHQTTDRLVYNAGTQEESPIRTILVYPSAVYGLGEGFVPLTVIYKNFGDLFIQSGVVGTFGPGHNKVGTVHVKDVASALALIFKLALDGRAKEKEHDFVNSDETEPFHFKEFAETSGKILHQNGLIGNFTEVVPFPNSAIEAWGELGWSVFGGNWSAVPTHLRETGWEPVESRKLPLKAAVPLEFKKFIDDRKSTV